MNASGCRPGRRVSVAVITYNGARFVQEQLASIVRQSRQPDEIVVVDDGSSDGTQPWLERFAGESPVPMHVEVNQRRLGPRDNAQRALGLTTGEIIFLADQDDVWEPLKVEQLLRVIEADEGVELVFSNALLIDADGRLIGRRLWDEVGFGSRLQTVWEKGGALDVLLRQPVVTGATAVVRRRLLDAALPFPDTGLHDEWLVLVAVATGSRVVALPEPLIRYRIHGANVAGTPTLNPVARLRDHVRGSQKRQAVLEQHEELLRRFGAELPRASREKIERSVEFRRRRQALPRRRAKRIVPVLRETVNGNYRRFARGTVSALFDLAAPAVDR